MPSNKEEVHLLNEPRRVREVHIISGKAVSVFPAGEEDCKRHGRGARLRPGSGTQKHSKRHDLEAAQKLFINIDVLKGDNTEEDVEKSSLYLELRSGFETGFRSSGRVDLRGYGENKGGFGEMDILNPSRIRP